MRDTLAFHLWLPSKYATWKHLITATGAVCVNSRVCIIGYEKPYSTATPVCDVRKSFVEPALNAHAYIMHCLQYIYSVHVFVFIGLMASWHSSCLVLSYFLEMLECYYSRSNFVNKDLCCVIVGHKCHIMI